MSYFYMSKIASIVPFLVRKLLGRYYFQLIVRRDARGSETSFVTFMNKDLEVFFFVNNIIAKFTKIKRDVFIILDYINYNYIKIKLHTEWKFT